MRHCSLNKYLFHFDRVDDLIYECEKEKETVEYYLLKCQIYDKEKDKLLKKGGIEGMRMEKLLDEFIGFKSLSPHF